MFGSAGALRPDHPLHPQAGLAAKGQMKRISADQITMECMDCGRRYLGPRTAAAPAGAVLHVLHCGCKHPLNGDVPFYIDFEGERMMEQPTNAPRSEGDA